MIEDTRARNFICPESGKPCEHGDCRLGFCVALHAGDERDAGIAKVKAAGGRSTGRRLKSKGPIYLTQAEIEALP